MLPYNRNVALQTLELFSSFTQLHNAAASPASRLRSAGLLAITISEKKKSSHVVKKKGKICIEILTMKALI